MAYADNLCAGSGYTGYGFDLPVEELPTPGNKKTFNRENKNEQGRDSLITLILTVIPNDTMFIAPITINNTQLPYVVDAYYTVPEDAPIGEPFETFVWKYGCSYNRYTVTVKEVPTSLEQIRTQSPIANKIIIDNQLFIIREGSVYNAQGILVK